MSNSTERRNRAWSEMELLEQAGVGSVVEVSKQRRKLVLPAGDAVAQLLSTNPKADGLIRADASSLLFRNASSALLEAVPRQLLIRSMASDKGLEFRWSVIGNEDITVLHSIILWLAKTHGTAPR